MERPRGSKPGEIQADTSLWSLAGGAESGSVGRGDGGSRLDKRDRIASPEPGTVALKRLLLTLLFCVLPHR